MLSKELIYDTMKSCGCDIITVCNGTAASMGAFLLASGTKGMRYCMPHAEVMIHQVMGGIQGQASDIEICAEHIRNKKNILNNLLSEMTGQPVEKISIDTDRDYYMSAAQAFAYGMVDHIGRPDRYYRNNSGSPCGTWHVYLLRTGFCSLCVLISYDFVPQSG